MEDKPCGDPWARRSVKALRGRPRLGARSGPEAVQVGVSRRLGWHEVQMTHAIFAAGGPAPEVLGVVTLEGRFGVVLPRFDGPTLLQLVRSGAVTREQAARSSRTSALSVHKTPAPPDVLSLRAWMDIWLRSARGMLPDHIATGVVALIERLQPGDGLCHGDLHPGNVIMTAEGPRLIDWTARCAGPPPSISGSATSCCPRWLRKSPTIRSGRVRSMRPLRQSTRGWPACPPRR
jgi:hypothetical protein